MDSNEIIANALCADDDKLWYKSQDLWEQALIATVKEKKYEWYGTSLVILCHIYDIMTKQFNFKMEDSMEHFASNKNYQPVGHWANVQNNDAKIASIKSSNNSYIFKIVIAIALIIVLFFVLSYPFNDMEIKIMVGLGILLFIIVGFIVGLLFNVFAGVVAFVGGCYLFDAICSLVANMFHLGDGDLAMLYIFRIIGIILAIYLIYSAINNKSDNKEIGKLITLNENKRKYLKEHSKDCYNAIIEIDNKMNEEDIMEVSAIQAYYAYTYADIYGFNHVSSSKDSQRLIKEINALRDYYGDMAKTDF